MRRRTRRGGSTQGWSRRATATRRRRTRLQQRVLHASIRVDLPGLDAVEVIGVEEVLGAHAHVLRRLEDGRLHLAALVGAARLQYGFLAVPPPWKAEARVRVPKDR